MKFMPQVISFIALFSLFHVPVFGNDGSYTEITNSQTGAAMPINNDTIAMVDEDIQIVVDRLGYFHNWLGMGMTPPYVTNGRVVTTCSFTFKNESSVRQTVLMGYPVTEPKEIYHPGNNGEEDVIQAVFSPQFYQFQVYAGGKKIPWSYATHKSNPQIPVVGDYDGVYLFTVTFEPNETVRIANTVIQVFKWNHPHPWFSYILTTGTTWKRPIGKSRIVVSFPDIEPEFLEYRSPAYPYSTFQGSTYIYDFHDFAPTRDLVVQFSLRVRKNSDFGVVLRRCAAAKDYEAIRVIHDVMVSGPVFTLQEAGLDVDFLRRMYFDAGNYFMRKREYKDAATMFQMSFYCSSPIIRWIKEHDGKDSSDWYWYCNAVIGIESSPQLQCSVSDAGIPAPSYYSLYNWTCANDRQDSSELNLLETALKFGFPKKEYAWIRQDPDLENLRREHPAEFEVLLKKYEQMK